MCVSYFWEHEDEDANSFVTRSDIAILERVDRGKIAKGMKGMDGCCTFSRHIIYKTLGTNCYDWQWNKTLLSIFYTSLAMNLAIKVTVAIKLLSVLYWFWMHLIPLLRLKRHQWMHIIFGVTHTSYLSFFYTGKIFEE